MRGEMIIVQSNNRFEEKRYQYQHRLTIFVYLQAALNRHGVLTDASFVYWINQQRKRRTGRDRFTPKELAEYIRSLGIEGWTDRRVRDALKAGKGILWDVIHQDRHDGRGVVYGFRSKERVMVALGIDDPGQKVLLPDEAWQGSLRRWLAFCWEAFSAHHNSNGKLTRENLAREFGVSRRTTIEYEKLTGADPSHSIG